MSSGISHPHRTRVRERPESDGGPVRRSMRIAAIDIGSNAIHLIVAEADVDGGIPTLWRMKEMVGLGRESFPARALSHPSNP